MKPSSANEVIVKCTSCGQLNRIRHTASTLRPRCGKCGSHLNADAPSAPKCSPPSFTHPDNNEKAKLYGLLGIGVLLAFFFVLTARPEETEWAVSSSTSMPYQYFAGAAFLVAAIYVFMLVRWYSADRFQWRTSVMALLICGAVSIVASLFVYALFYAIAVREVQFETGWWIFRSSHIAYVYSSPVFQILDSTAAIAALIEEPAKFGALLVVPQVRKAITDRRSGLYYATLCAFGFALIENVMYFQAHQTVLFMRANPAHAVFTSIWGAAYGSWIAKQLSMPQLVKGFAYGIGLHALWNLCAQLDHTVFLITFGAVMWLGLGFIRRELTGDQRIPAHA